MKMMKGRRDVFLREKIVSIKQQIAYVAYLAALVLAFPWMLKFLAWYAVKVGL